MTASETGREAEARALRYLKRKRYRLLDQNYRAGHHELDLVMRQGDRIVFIEVRARKNASFGTPAETIGAAKRRFLLLAAEQYLMQHRLTERAVRFDVVEVYLDEDRLSHIENAFGRN